MHRDAGVSAEPGFVLWSHGDRSRRHLGRSHGSRYAGRSRGGGGSVRVRKMLPMSVPWAARRLTAVRQASGPAGRSPRGVACRRRRVVQNSTRTGKLVTRYRSERARVTRVMYNCTLKQKRTPAGWRPSHADGRAGGAQRPYRVIRMRLSVGPRPVRQSCTPAARGRPGPRRARGVAAQLSDLASVRWSRSSVRRCHARHLSVHSNVTVDAAPRHPIKILLGSLQLYALRDERPLGDAHTLTGTHARQS